MRRFMGSPRHALLRGLLFVALLVPTASLAQIIDEEEVGRLTIGGSIGFGGNSMSRYNENIGVVNHFISRQGVPLRNADELDGGSIVRGEIRYKMSDRFVIGFGVGNAESKSAFDVQLGATNFYARSTLVMPALYYNLPFVQTSEAFINVADRVNLYVGGGPICYTNARTRMLIIDRSTEPVFNVDGDLGELDGEAEASGTGFGFQGLIGGSYQLTKTFSVAAEAGYRIGKVSDLKIDKLMSFVRDDTENDPNRREYGDRTIEDFFERDERPTDPPFPDRDIEGDPIPYYSDFDGPLDLDFSGITLTIGLRMHIF
jgi:hypothetical protein